MNKLHQVIFLAYFHMRSRYRKTIAGFIWVIAGPILTFLVQSLIFKEIFKFNIENYPLFLLAGLLPWFFISQTLSSVTSSLVMARDVLLAFKIDPKIIVASQVLDQFASFLSAFFILSLFFVVPELKNYSIFRFFLVFLSFFSIFYFVLTMSLFLTFWHVFYRDVVFVTQFLMSLAFYVTPVFYREDIFPVRFAWILKINFIAPFIKIFQNTIYQWNVVLWEISFIQTIVVNCVLTFFVYLSYKTKMKVFYINV